LIANGPIRILSEPRKIFTTTSVIRNSFKKLAKASDAGALIPGLVLGDTSLQFCRFYLPNAKSWVISFNRS